MNEGNRKKYLFAAYTDFDSGKLTGAHRRFLELLKYTCRDRDVLFVGKNAQALKSLENISVVEATQNRTFFLPKHIAGGISLYRAIKENKQDCICDYAVSFSPVVSIFYRLAGIRHIVSLFREDLIGYQKALSAGKLKVCYFRLQEVLAVKFSEKIIVQCINDRKNLILRNRKFCRDIEKKVFIQINNTNASWMKTETVSRQQNSEVPTILFIGNFSDRRKGHSLLIPAVKKLMDEGSSVRLICAGGGKELDDWKEQCEGYSDIVFIGHVTDMAKYLGQSDILIVPSLIDSCPNTVLEGLNAGLAVYGANTGGIPDLLQEETYMFLPDVDAIYLFLKRVLKSGRYKDDAQRQKQVKERLSFDWGERIIRIIEAK